MTAPNSQQGLETCISTERPTAALNRPEFYGGYTITSLPDHGVQCYPEVAESVEHLLRLVIGNPSSLKDPSNPQLIHSRTNFFLSTRRRGG